MDINSLKQTLHVKDKSMKNIFKTSLYLFGILLLSCLSAIIAIAVWGGLAFLFDKYGPTYSQPVLNIISGLILISATIFMYIFLYKKVFKNKTNLLVYIVISAAPYVFIIGSIVRWIKTFPFL